VLTLSSDYKNVFFHWMCFWCSDYLRLKWHLTPAPVYYSTGPNGAGDSVLG